MYIIALLVLLMVLFITITSSGSIITFFDLPSFIIVLLITLSMLLASGLFKDFIRSFKIVMAKDNTFSKEELKKSLIAIEMTMKLLLVSGGIGTITGIVMLLRKLSDPSSFGPSLAITILTWFYALLIWVIFLPIREKIRSFIVDMKE